MNMHKIIVFIISIFYTNIVLAQANGQPLPAVSYSSSVLQMLLGLLFVISMIFVVIWLMKKVGYQGYTSSGHIKVKSTLALSSKEKIVLLEIGKEQVLIGVSASGIQAIKTLDNPLLDEAESTSINTPLFSEKLKLMLTKNHQAE